MSEPIARETGLEKARELSETILIHQDMQGVVASLQLWANEFADLLDPRSKAIAGSLFRDAITQFVACFDGDRNKYPLVVETVYANVEGIAPYFRFLRNLRSGYTAHRSGAARQCAIGVVYTEHGVAITQQTAHYTGQGLDGRENLIAIAQMAVNFAARQIEALYAELADQLREWTPEQIDALPATGIKLLQPNQISLSRGDVLKAIAKEPVGILEEFPFRQ